MFHILIVEDDKELRELFQLFYLKMAIRLLVRKMELKHLMFWIKNISI